MAIVSTDSVDLLTTILLVIQTHFPNKQATPICFCTCAIPCQHVVHMWEKWLNERRGREKRSCCWELWTLLFRWEYRWCKQLVIPNSRWVWQTYKVTMSLHTGKAQNIFQLHWEKNKCIWRAQPFKMCCSKCSNQKGKSEERGVGT